MKENLATITSAGLEIKERAILTFWIFVDYEEGSSQGVGGFALDSYDDNIKERVGTAYGLQMIIELLSVLGVNDLHEAKGQNIFILGECEGLSFKPKGIKSLRSGTGKSLIFEDVFLNKKGLKC